MDTNIRWLTRADVPVVNRINRKCGTGDTVRDWIENTPAICSVIEHESEIVGFFMYELKKTRSIILHHIVVDASFRRKGVGSKAVRSLIDKLNSKRNKIQVDVSDSNLGFHLFMKSVGFKAVGVEGDSYRFVYLSDSNIR